MTNTRAFHGHLHFYAKMPCLRLLSIPGLFVKEAKSMHEFMLNDSLRHAADSKTSSQVDSLSASLLAANVGTENRENVYYGND